MIFVNMNGSTVTTPFLPNLTSVLGDVTIQEFSLLNGQPAVFSQLPLRSVKVIGGSLNAIVTGPTDMSSFAGLQCIWKSLNIVRNPQLRSLAGLEGFAVVDPGNIFNATNPAVYIFGKSLLTNPSGFSDNVRALSRVAGCSSIPPPNFINITIANPSPSCPTCTCGAINTYGELCAYIKGEPFYCAGGGSVPPLVSPLFQRPLCSLL